KRVTKKKVSEKGPKVVAMCLRGWGWGGEHHAHPRYSGFGGFGAGKGRGRSEPSRVTGDRHGAVLQEAAANPPLRAPDNFAAPGHQFVPRRRQKTWRIRIIAQQHLARVCCEHRGNAKPLISEA